MTDGFTPNFEIHDELHFHAARSMGKFKAFAESVAKAQAEAQERLARKAAATFLPRGLGWLLDHPRLLKAVYRIRPGWRPTLVVSYDNGERGSGQVTTIRDKNGVIYTLSTWTTASGVRIEEGAA